MKTIQIINHPDNSENTQSDFSTMPAKNIFEHQKEDAEALHKCFFKAHWQLTGAAEQFNKALKIIQERETYCDDRPHAKELRVLIESLRESAETLWHSAAELRTALIGYTGCDGSCHK